MEKNQSANAGDLRELGSIPQLGRSPRVGNGNPLQYSCLGNPKDGEAWRAPGDCNELDMTEHTRIVEDTVCPKSLKD